MCAYNVQHLKLIALHGVVPLLVYIITNSVPLQPLALQLILAFAMSQCLDTKTILVEQGGVQCLLSILNNKELAPNWVYSSLSAIGGL